ncbi:MAG: glutathione S-transferase family protein [Caulobacterales bacterium]
MLTLYHSPMSRSSRIIWLLEEIETRYEVVYVDIQRQDGSGQRDVKNLHPDKKVPALLHDGMLVTESAAICLYLTDLFPSANIGFGPNDFERGPYLTWLFFYAGEAESALTHKMLGLTDSNPAFANAYHQMVGRLLAALKQGPFVMGDRFTAADILFGSMAQYTRQALPADPLLDAYAKRLSERPAFLRAVAKDSPPAR